MKYTFEAEVDLDLTDADTKELFTSHVEHRLQAALHAAVRVTNKELPAFKSKKSNERYAEKLAELQRETDIAVAKAKKETEDRIAERQRIHDEQMAKHNEWMSKSNERIAANREEDRQWGRSLFPAKPGKESPIKLEGETEEQFLRRLADNANARRAWDKLNM